MSRPCFSLLLLLPVLFASVAYADDDTTGEDSSPKIEEDTSEEAEEIEKEEPKKKLSPSKLFDLAEELVKENFRSIAIIEGDAGSGTGVILVEGETTYLYTAAHVIAGNKRLTVKNTEGRQFTKFGTFEVAGKSDLARIELLEKFDSGISLSKPGSCKVDAPLLAIGNSGGAGVLTVIKGNARSLGPDSIEVSNKVIQGNSGGPVFSGETAELLGIVTHAVAAREDIWAKNTDFDEVRRFATRLDRPIKWRKMKIGNFLKESGRLETFNRNTRILFAISVLDPTQNGLRLDTRIGDTGPTVLSIIEENKDVPTVATLIEMNTELGDKKMRTSENDLKRRFSRYYAGAIFDLNKDSKTFSPAAFSGYKQKDAKQAKEWRADAIKKVEDASKRLR